MDLNNLLIWFIGIACVTGLLRMLGDRTSGTAGWIVVCGFLLALLGGAYVVAPDMAGYIAGGFWCVFYLLPVYGMRRLNRLVAKEDYDAAARIVRLPDAVLIEGDDIRRPRLEPADGVVAVVKSQPNPGIAVAEGADAVRR